MTIVLGLSGGVDSALAAALLVERGVSVQAVYLAFRAPGQSECRAREDIAMCRRIAAHLDIPFTVHDVSDAYEERVLAPMVDGYARGVTPNPDSACNRWVKFDELLRIAAERSADGIATGHYARIRRAARGRVELRCGADAEKDQSYFLWELTQEQIRATLFPIGAYTKERVRTLARARGLPNWDRPSTRGVCFLGRTDFADYLAERGVTHPATVVTTAGEHLGDIPAGSTYTIGQRIRMGGQPAARYVVARDARAQTLTVSSRPDDPARARDQLLAHSPNWIGGIPPRVFGASARIRHRHAPAHCEVRVASAGLSVSFERPQIGIAPGQAIVFSDGDRVLGGAVIAS